MSQGDPRERHRGLSHHTATVLDLLLRPVVVALPEGPVPRAASDRVAGHTGATGAADLDGYRRSRLPSETMGRSLSDDELFFRAALAGGSVLAGAIPAGGRAAGSPPRRMTAGGEGSA